MSTPPDVRLTLPARPEGVAVVRQALAGMADALAFDAAVVADMKMAISEACTNVVVHAYDEEDGVLEVEMSAGESGLTIRVRDHGTGIRPHGERRGEAPALGLGLPLIAALSDSYELTGTSGRGTEVQDDVRLPPRGRSRRGQPRAGHRRRRRPLGPGRLARAPRAERGSAPCRGAAPPVPSVAVLRLRRHITAAPVRPRAGR